jgi:uncharacterized protein (TIGR03083 family)
MRVTMATTVTTVTQDKWVSVRAAVRAAGERFVELVATAPDPRALVTADWSVADTVAHIVTIAWSYTALLQSDDAPLPIPGLREPFLATTVDTVSDLNVVAMGLFTERDPQRLVDQLRTHVDDILRMGDGLDPTRLVTWLGGSRIPVAGVFAHLLNELEVHGRDIARAIRFPWTTSPEDAALFFELFVVEIMRDPGRVLDNEKPVRPGRIAVEFRSRYTSPVTLVLDNGRVSVERPRSDNDVRLHFEPVTMNLVLFHRISTPRAALTGKVRVWGRRPWLLQDFLRTVHLP